MYLKKFSARLKELMELEGLSNRALSMKIQADRKSIRFWLSGKFFPRHDALMHLANYFKVSIDYLVGLDDVIGIPLGSTGVEQNFDYIRENVGFVISMFIKKCGLSQYAIAKLLCIDQKSVKQMIEGQSIPETGTLIKISQLTKVTMNELLGRR